MDTSKIPPKAVKNIIFFDHAKKNKGHRSVSSFQLIQMWNIINLKKESICIIQQKQMLHILESEVC